MRSDRLDWPEIELAEPAVKANDRETVRILLRCLAYIRVEMPVILTVPHSKPPGRE
jgi:hypothetical protein